MYNFLIWHRRTLLSSLGTTENWQRTVEHSVLRRSDRNHPSIDGAILWYLLMSSLNGEANTSFRANCIAQLWINRVSFSRKDISPSIVRLSSAGLGNAFPIIFIFSSRGPIVTTPSFATFWHRDRQGPGTRMSTALQFQDVIRLISQSLVLWCLCSNFCATQFSKILKAYRAVFYFKINIMCRLTTCNCRKHKSYIL